MSRPKKTVVPVKPQEQEELKNYIAIKKQLSLYDKIKQFFNQFNLL